MHPLLLSLILALSPWGPTSCASVEAPGKMEWVQLETDKTQYALMQGTRQLGNYHTDLKEYHPLQANGQFQKGNHTPPLPLPTELRLIEQAPDITNYGVDRSHLNSKERYIVNGMSVTSAEAFHALTEKNIPNDKDLLRLTIIGSEELRKQVRRDLDSAPELSAFKGKYLVQDYAPGNWAVKDGFFTDGKPTIYLQAPNGKVLHRQDDYSDGAAGLATALRKADPNYSPAEDRDARKNLRIPVFSAYVPLALLVIVGLVILLIPNKQKQVPHV